MKCKCSLNNNYEVIGLCDIEKFNQKIREFTDKSWTQVIIPEKLVLPNNKPSIKNITKVYLDIKITSTKVIKTSSSDTPNAEGLALTGKLLLVSGHICQRIIYISETVYDIVCSAKFNVSFSTYIVVDKNTDLENDYFCIYPCVEDVSVRQLTERILTKSVTLFLFAHKTTQIIPQPPKPPVIGKLPNTFVFNTFDTDDKMAKIEFDRINKELIVTSTGLPYSTQPNGNAFNFELRGSDGRVKFSEAIENNQNADRFRDNLNSQSFEFGDTIGLFYSDSSKVFLNNYPNLNDIYNMVGNNRAEQFIITSEGITPILTPNKITIKSKNNQEVLNIQFVRSRQIFIVSSTGVVPDPTSTEPYLRFMLKDENGDDLIKATLNSNENPSSFKFQVNGRPFEYGRNSLTLIYKDNFKVEISNFPNNGDAYTPIENFNIFIIEPNDLRDIAFNNKIKIINDNNEEMSGLYFIRPFTQPIITITTTSTSAISTTLGRPNEKYAEYLQYSILRPEIYTEILKRENALNFARALNNRPIDINEPKFLRLSNRLNERIIITKYKGQDEYKVGEEPEFLEVRDDSFVPHALNYNKIRFKNRNDSTILYIYFDKVRSDNIYIEPYSTGIINTDTDSFSFKILESDGIGVRLDKTIDRGENGDVVIIDPPYNIFNQFRFGSLFTIEQSDPSLVEIYDFPFTSQPRNPTGISQTFAITENGLVPISKLSINRIIFRGFNTARIAEVTFNTQQNTLTVTSTGTMANRNFAQQEYFALQLKAFDGTLRAESSVKGNENANIFRDELNGEDFEYDDIITLRFKQPERIEILNFPNISDNFEPQASTITYSVKITQNGLEAFAPLPAIVKLQNAFIFKNFQDEQVAKIEFDIANMNLIVATTGATVPFSQSQTVFIFDLLDSNGNSKAKGAIGTNSSNLNDFKNSLNNQDFEFGDSINLFYIYPELGSLSNYPNIGESYTVPSDDHYKDFSITSTGIVPK